MKVELGDKNMTNWFKKVSENFKLVTFQFPSDDNMHTYLNFPAEKPKDIKQIAEHYHNQMKVEYPESLSYYHVHRHSNEYNVRYKIYCTQRPKNQGEVCRAFFYYTYSEENGCFTMTNYNNTHSHFPKGVTNEQIQDIHNEKIFGYQKSVKEYREEEMRNLCRRLNGHNAKTPGKKKKKKQWTMVRNYTEK